MITFLGFLQNRWADGHHTDAEAADGVIDQQWKNGRAHEHERLRRQPSRRDGGTRLDVELTDDREAQDHILGRLADGKVAPWRNRSEILTQPESRSTREELTSRPINLLRQQTPLQLNDTDATTTGGVLLQWSHPFQTRQSLPTSSLCPLTPGGYTIENLQHVTR